MPGDSQQASIATIRNRLVTTTERSGVISPGQTYTEIGIVNHEGREFAAVGSRIDDVHLVAYLAAAGYDDNTKTGRLTTWDGTHIGTFVIQKTWRTRTRYTSTDMHQVDARLTDGRLYHGRSQGLGMVFSGRRDAKSLRLQRERDTRAAVLAGGLQPFHLPWSYREVSPASGHGRSVYQLVERRPIAGGFTESYGRVYCQKRNAVRVVKRLNTQKEGSR